MKFQAFRITNFRSIVDTGWCSFSPDGITVLVGENESGKSSILDALSMTFNNINITDDDCRVLEPLPLIYVRLHIAYDEIQGELNEFTEIEQSVVREYFTKKKSIVEMKFGWTRTVTDGKTNFSADYQIDDPRFEEILIALAPVAASSSSEVASSSEKAPQELDDEEEEEEEEEDEDTAPLVAKHLTFDDVKEAIMRVGPTTIPFDERTGLLPDRIDIITTKERIRELSGDGSAAAKNFLSIADISLDELVEGDSRTRETLLGRANSTISRTFGDFWTQVIGKSDKIQLECAIRNYGSENPQKVGQPHLVFWIKDGQNRLYPRQRSQGVRWFVSFFLQLNASQKENYESIFLLDEPGANLHGKAQADVLKLLNKLRTKLTIVYSTHTPGLVEYEKLFRVLAVQRDGETDDSRTVVIDAHKLSSASRDTLSTLLAAMGSDLAQQQVVRKKDNVILEEISAFYYLRAFWLLTGSKQSAHFIAATGANNVEPMANMFLGWGLDFIVVLDDEPTGRGVYNRMKRNLCGDSDDRAKEMMLKIAGCAGIEDVFSKDDFAKYVLGDLAPAYDGSNSEHVKETQRAKAVLGYQFLIKVEEAHIRLKDFDQPTRNKIEEIVREIEKRLKGHK